MSTDLAQRPPDVDYAPDDADYTPGDIELTPSDIAKRLVGLSRHLRAAVKELRRLGQAAAVAKRDAEVAYARAFLEAEGPMDVRKQLALLAAADARLKVEIANSEVSAFKEVLKAIHADLDVGRSLSATTRDEMRLSGSGAMGA